MIKLHFKNFMEVRKHVNDMYDKVWRSRFDALEPKRQKHFAHFFPAGQNRIYLPLNISEKQIKDEDNYYYKQSIYWKNKISDLIKPHGYKIQNWPKGIIATPQKQTTTIGRVLFKLNPEMAKEYEMWSTGKDAGVRIAKNNKYLIIISQDVHDIAKQSTGRNWESCNSLRDVLPEEEEDRYDKEGNLIQKGYTYNKLAKEILEGGLIAYLCYENDKDIKNPIARISIKRYENEATGKSIALCNDFNKVVYGNQLLSKYFNDAVVKWLYDTQSIKQIVGTFKKVGAGGIDGHKYEVDFEPNENLGFTKDIVDFYSKSIDYYIKNNKEYELEAIAKKIYYQLVKQPTWNIPEEFWQKAKPHVINVLDDNKIEKIISKFPGKIKPDDLLAMNKNQLSSLIYSNYNNYYDNSKEFIEKLKDVLINKINSISENDNVNNNELQNIMKYTKSVPESKWFHKITDIIGLMDRLIDSYPNKATIFDYITSFRYGLFGIDEKLVRNYFQAASKFIEKNINKLNKEEMFFAGSDIKHFIKSAQEKNMPFPNVA